MASKYTGRPASRPWRARVKENRIEYFLGYYTTKEEALAVELEFKRKGREERESGNG